VLVAERDGCLVGWIWIVHASPADDPGRLPVTIGEGEVFGNGLTVLPQSRRRGVGTALLVARNARARALGARAVLSHVDSGNAAALALQHRFGARIRRELIVVDLLCRFRLVRVRASTGRAIPRPPRPAGG
jgi:GNAT superfamily N-acetyltransferase